MTRHRAGGGAGLPYRRHTRNGEPGQRREIFPAPLSQTSWRPSATEWVHGTGWAELACAAAQPAIMTAPAAAAATA